MVTSLNLWYSNELYSKYFTTFQQLFEITESWIIQNFKKWTCTVFQEKTLTNDLSLSSTTRENEKKPPNNTIGLAMKVTPLIKIETDATKTIKFLDKLH